MASKPDRRVRRTRNAIEDALIALTIDKGYESVTVREIIDRADVGRSTFYAHYTDKQDVLLACVDRLQRFLTPPPSEDTHRGLGFPHGLFEHTTEQRQLYHAFIHRRGPAALVQTRIEQLLGDALRDQLAALQPPGTIPPVPLEVLIRCLVGAYLALLTGWLDGEIGPTQSPTDMEAMFRVIAKPTITTALGLPPTGPEPGSGRQRSRSHP